MTFRAFDIDKLMAYIPHVEIVNGTRIVEQLRAEQTQLTTVHVLRQLRCREAARNSPSREGHLHRRWHHVQAVPERRPATPAATPRFDGDLEFNAHFLDTALDRG